MKDDVRCTFSTVTRFEVPNLVCMEYVGKQRDCLNCLAETHFIGENAGVALTPSVVHPIHAFQLVVSQLRKQEL